MIYIICRDVDDFLTACERRGFIPDLEARIVTRSYQLVGINGRGNQFFATPLSGQNPQAPLLRTLVKEIQDRADFQEQIDHDLRTRG